MPKEQKKQKICNRGHIYKEASPCPLCWPGYSKKKKDREITEDDLKFIHGEDYPMFKEKIIPNCDCTLCRDNRIQDPYGSTIVHYRIFLNYLNDMILRGTCAKCGNDVVRYLETSQVPAYAGRIAIVREKYGDRKKRVEGMEEEKAHSFLSMKISTEKFTPTEIARIYFALHSRGDFENMKQLFADSSSYALPSVGFFHGQDQIITTLRSFRSKFTSLEWTMKSIAKDVEQDVIRIKFSFSGTFQNRKKVTAEGFEYIQVKDGKVEHVDVRYTDIKRPKN